MRFFPIAPSVLIMLYLSRGCQALKAGVWKLTDFAFSRYDQYALLIKRLHLYMLELGFELVWYFEASSAGPGFLEKV
jgi:hypothetical protein